MSGERIEVTRAELDEIRGLAARLMNAVISVDIRLEDVSIIDTQVMSTHNLPPGVVSLDAYRARRAG